MIKNTTKNIEHIGYEPDSEYSELDTTQLDKIKAEESESLLYGILNTITKGVYKTYSEYLIDLFDSHPECSEKVDICITEIIGFDKYEHKLLIDINKKFINSPRDLHMLVNSLVYCGVIHRTPIAITTSDDEFGVFYNCKNFIYIKDTKKFSIPQFKHLYKECVLKFKETKESAEKEHKSAIKINSDYKDLYVGNTGSLYESESIDFNVVLKKRVGLGLDEFWPFTFIMPRYLTRYHSELLPSIAFFNFKSSYKNSRGVDIYRFLDSEKFELKEGVPCIKEM